VNCGHKPRVREVVEDDLVLKIERDVEGVPHSDVSGGHHRPSGLHSDDFGHDSAEIREEEYVLFFFFLCKKKNKERVIVLVLTQPGEKVAVRTFRSGPKLTARKHQRPQR
jgi:hypothetical protein